MIPSERSLEIARQLAEFWAWRLETRQPEPNRLDIVMASPDDVVPFAAGLRVQRIGTLAAITGLDLGPEAGELELLYHFCHGSAVITLRLKLDRSQAVVPSLTGIIPNAESSERETAEMFGVTFAGLRAMPRLYLPDDWPAGHYPLRKDAVVPVGSGD
jgi:NADH:ubiquinone oxidoreductase subunit C